MLGMRPRHVLVIVLLIVIVLAFRLFSPRSTRSTLSTQSRPAPAAARVPNESGGGRDVAVPASCTPEVNQKLADLLAQQTTEDVDNVMVCGTTISPSRTQRGGRHGSHEILPLVVNLPGAGSKLVEVVINDDLDGAVTAPKGARFMRTDRRSSIRVRVLWRASTMCTARHIARRITAGWWWME